MQRKVKAIFTAFSVTVFLVGAAVLAYPLVHGSLVDNSLEQVAGDFLSYFKINPYREDEVVLDFFTPTEPEETTPRQYAELWEDMSRYNTQLYEEKQAGLSSISAYTIPSFVLKDYGLDSEVFGVISIPSLALEMPLLLGATTQNMADGAAILSQTSVPLGGPNTNSVIAGHRGYNGASYFRYITDLQIGDIVTVTNLWECLTYKVVATEIIEPNEYESILIQEGKDMITLLTCHPYASGGKQRYLVFCERCP